MAIPKRASERIATGLKKYQAILAEARNRDISESDTVVIIGDLLAELLGYRKYVEITTEFAVRGTFVDLAVKVENEVRFLVEAKAIGVELKDQHVKQAIDYGANQGVEWILLTNAIVWRVDKIQFGQPIDKTLVFELDLLKARPRDNYVLECFGNLSREGFTQSSMRAFQQQQEATSKFSVAAVLMSEAVLTAIRRELRRIHASVRIDEAVLYNVVRNDVLKREVVDSDEARVAQDALKKSLRSVARAKKQVQPSAEVAGTAPALSSDSPTEAVAQAAPD